MNDDWIMGALAAQDDYRPLGNDPWTNTIAPRWQPPEGTAFAAPNEKRAGAQMERAIAPDRGMAFGTMTPQEETIALPERARAAVDMVVPQSPLDLGMMLAAGPGGKLARMGGLAAGVTAEPSEAEAGKAKLIKGLFDYSRLHEVPNVPQFDLPRNIPPRGVPERTLDITNDRTVRDKISEVITQGKEMGGAKWYNADPLREAFVKELGSKGDTAFRKYMDMVAATSPRSDVASNARNASYYYGREMRGEGMPAVGDKNPQPYGHLAQRLHQMNAERVAGPGWDPLNNPKPASFVENLVGNQQPVTVDTHAFRLPAILAKDPRFLETAFQVSKDAPKQNIQEMLKSGELKMGDVADRAAYWQAQPKANEYAAMEKFYQSLGKDLGLTPAQTQASAWVGGGKLTGLASDESKPFLRFLEDRIEKTAEKSGQSTKQTLKDFIRGRAPLY